MNEIAEAQTAPTGNSEKVGLIPDFLACRPYSYCITSPFIKTQRELWVVKPQHVCSSGHVLFFCPASLLWGITLLLILQYSFSLTMAEPTRLLTEDMELKPSQSEFPIFLATLIGSSMAPWLKLKSVFSGPFVRLVGKMHSLSLGPCRHGTRVWLGMRVSRGNQSWKIERVLIILFEPWSPAVPETIQWAKKFLFCFSQLEFYLWHLQMKGVID